MTEQGEPTRLTVVPASGTLSGYARLYGPLAVAAVPIGFLPILASETVRESSGVTRTTTYGTLWETAAGANGSPAAVGLLLLGILVALLTVATFRAHSRSLAVPIGIAVTAALIALMLITKPGARVGADLTGAGTVGLVLAIATFVLSVAHAVHVSRVQALIRRVS